MPAEEPTRDDLVQHLVACMEQQGITIEAADAPGQSKPRAVKLGGLRLGRVRPDVVGLDGRRTIFGKAVPAEEVDDSRLPDRLEALARSSRTLIVCIPGRVADEALGTLFQGDSMLNRAKMRLLVHPRATWEELPKPPVRPR